MEKLIVNIGMSSDHYGAYAEDCPGVYGAGNTIDETKNSVMEGLRLLVETQPKNNLPDILKGEYEVIYKYDVQSLLKYYERIFSRPVLEKITGINQKQLHHYALGLSKPRPAQRKKIQQALHDLANELLQVEL